MASLTCAISNEVPDCPVVSPVSGQVYERRLIEKYIEENGVDPINREALSLDQLIEIKTTPLVKPKPPSATSIPAILKSLQDEWDAVMLHSFTLRQQLQTARQELSHALYQHDAARLNKEVTAAREALATLKPQAGAGTPMIHTPSHAQPPTPGHEPPQPQAHAMEATGMTADIIEKLQEKATVLTQERKKRGKTSMSLKSALVLGATGETGREVLNKLVATPSYGKIVSVGRRLIDLPEEEGFKRVEQKVVNFDKLDEYTADFNGIDAAFCCLGTTRDKAGKEGFKRVEQKVVNFHKLDEYTADFNGIDAAFCCLGTTRGKAGKEGFVKVDHDYVLKSAELLKAAGCPDFHLLTRKGSNSNSWLLYRETKGRVEDSVRGLGFDRYNIYRPGLLKCDRAESRRLEAAFRRIANKVDIHHVWSVPTSMVAAAMVNNSLVPSTKEIMEHHHIVEAAANKEEQIMEHHNIVEAEANKEEQIMEHSNIVEVEAPK